MHFSWQKHLELSRIVSNNADNDSGNCLALVGIALTILAKDLSMYEASLSGTNARSDTGLRYTPLQSSPIDCKQQQEQLLFHAVHVMHHSFVDR